MVPSVWTAVLKQIRAIASRIDVLGPGAIGRSAFMIRGPHDETACFQRINYGLRVAIGRMSFHSDPLHPVQPIRGRTKQRRLAALDVGLEKRDPSLMRQDRFHGDGLFAFRSRADEGCDRQDLGVGQRGGQTIHVGHRLVSGSTKTSFAGRSARAASAVNIPTLPPRSTTVAPSAVNFRNGLK